MAARQDAEELDAPIQLIKPRRFGDERGWFSETFNAAAWAKLGVAGPFVQDNHSLSREPYVLRGLHFQAPPFAQAKLVRCSRGRIWDVAVDVRKGSPSYGQWAAAELAAENGLQLFVPVGFAHGFLTLEPDTEVQYKVTSPYVAHAEGGLIWNDADLALPWPLNGASPVLSPKDLRLSRLSDFDSPFAYGGQPLVPGDLQAVSP